MCVLHLYIKASHQERASSCCLIGQIVSQEDLIHKVVYGLPRSIRNNYKTPPLLDLRNIYIDRQVRNSITQGRCTYKNRHSMWY